jgi:hypothetical protein
METLQKTVYLYSILGITVELSGLGVALTLQRGGRAASVIVGTPT